MIFSNRLRKQLTSSAMNLKNSQKQLSSARRNQDATIRKTKESQSTHARSTAKERSLVTDSGQLSERERDSENDRTQEMPVLRQERSLHWCVTMKATFMVIWDASTNKTRGAGFLMTCITKDGANVSFARMETIKAWVAHCLTRQRMLSKHGTNATKRIEHGQKTRQLYIPTILL